MEAQIRYARREDGATTAYAVMGSGPVLVVPPGFLSHLESNLRPMGFWGVLNQHRTVVLYDRHGCGLSDRHRTDFTAEDDMRDLYAVIDALDADSVDLFGLSTGGLIGVRFAADKPERLRKLILWGSGPFHDEARFPPEMRARRKAMRDLRRSDPDAFMRFMATRMFPDGVVPDEFRHFVNTNNRTATVEMQEQLETVVFDNLPLIPLVQAPTLVLHRRGDAMVPFAAGEYMARKIPNARFVPLDGGEHLPFFGEVDIGLRAIVDFLTEGEQPASAAQAAAFAPLPSGTATVLFTDIADSTALTERMGDGAFRSASAALDEQLRTAIRDAGGTAVDGKVLGDGVMAVFTSAAMAIGAARSCLALSAESELKLHIGLHAGDVIREESNVYGGAVNIASRICGLSSPGEILVSNTIRDLARTSAGVTFEDRGEHSLKGVSDPIHVFAVGTQ